MFETEHQRKAWIETLAVMTIVVALLFITGLKYLDPPPPGNIAVNFSYNDAGRRGNKPVVRRQENARSPSQMPKKQSPSPAREKILTTNQPDRPKIKTSPAPQKKETQDRPQPDETARKALQNILNAPDQAKGSNENNAPSSSSTGDTRTGQGTAQNPSPTTGGNDPNYKLGNRKALVKPKPAYPCNEEGTVVVKIWVNRQGKVFKAEKTKGTRALKCLTDAAVQAALATRWEPDPTAPPVQIGTITYHFKLQE